MKKNYFAPAVEEVVLTGMLLQSLQVASGGETSENEYLEAE